MRKKIGTSSFVTGFQAWWKINPKVSDHEDGKENLSYLEKLKALAIGPALQKKWTKIDMEIGETNSQGPITQSDLHDKHIRLQQNRSDLEHSIHFENTLL